MYTTDFVNYYEFILPQSIAWKGGGTEFDMMPHFVSIDETTNMIYVRGIVWVDREGVMESLGDPENSSNI